MLVIFGTIIKEILGHDFKESTILLLFKLFLVFRRLRLKDAADTYVFGRIVFTLSCPSNSAKFVAYSRLIHILARLNSVIFVLDVQRTRD